MSNAVTKKETPQEAFSRLVDQRAQAFLTEQLGPERAGEVAGRFALSFKVLARQNPNLYTCSPMSVAIALAMCTITGLLPGGVNPDVYLVPRKEKGEQAIQWMISYRGLTKLVNRAGARLRAVPVFEGDHFDYEEGLSPRLEHKPDLNVPREFKFLVGVYVVAKFSDGSTQFEVLPRGEIEKRRGCSDSYTRGSQSPWINWPVEMAMKTAIRWAISRGIAPIDPEAAVAIRVDGEQDGIEVIDEPVAQVTPRLTTTSSWDALEEALTETIPEPVGAA